MTHPACTCYVIVGGKLVQGAAFDTPGMTGALVTTTCPRHAYITALYAPKGAKTLVLEPTGPGTARLGPKRTDDDPPDDAA